MTRRSVTEAEWLAAYADPVVRAKTVHSTKFHRPDPECTEPAPACTVRGETRGFVVKERSFAERAREPCRRPECFREDDPVSG
jgi:hypothetical protein